MAFTWKWNMYGAGINPRVLTMTYAGTADISIGDLLRRGNSSGTSMYLYFQSAPSSIRSYAIASEDLTGSTDSQSIKCFAIQPGDVFEVSCIGTKSTYCVKGMTNAETSTDYRSIAWSSEQSSATGILYVHAVDTTNSTVEVSFPNSYIWGF